MRSVRGSSPKMVAGTVTEPDFLPSSDVIFSSMSRAPCILADCDRGRRFIVGELELAGLWHALGQLLLHRVAHRDPAALGARHGALDQDEAARHVGLHDFEIERGHALDTKMAGHFLVLEGLAGILTAAGRTDRAVRDRHAMACAQAGEIPALHAAGKALAGRSAGDVDILTDEEMIRRDLGADRDQPVVVDAELGELALGLDLGDREVAAVRLGGALHLALAGAELQRDVAVLVLGAMGDDLAIAEAEHRHRHMLTGLGEEARHPDLLCEHSGTHVFIPYRALELDLDVDAGGKVELHQRIDRLRRRIDDVEQAFMRAHFELLAALLVDVRRAVDREFFDLGRQRDRPAYLRAGALRRIDDLARRRIEDAVIARLEPDSYFLTVHCRSLCLSSSAEADDPVIAGLSLPPRYRGY